MRLSRSPFAPALLAFTVATAALGVHMAAADGPYAAPQADPPPAGTLQIPGLPPVAMPPGVLPFPPGSDMPRYALPPAAQPSPQPAPSAAEATPPVPPPSAGRKAAAEPSPQPPKRMLDELFARLAKSTDVEESQGIAGAIERVWLHSGSDTADLLMSRALEATQSKDNSLAATLLGRIVAIEPDWAEAWNKRAMLRYQADDDWGAMTDIAEVLKREPRHFAAMAGMGYILQRADMNKQALQVFRKVLELYPQLTIVRDIVKKLTVEVEGRDI